MDEIPSEGRRAVDISVTLKRQESKPRSTGHPQAGLGQAAGRCLAGVLRSRVQGRGSGTWPSLTTSRLIPGFLATRCLFIAHVSVSNAASVADVGSQENYTLNRKGYGRRRSLWLLLSMVAVSCVGRLHPPADLPAVPIGQEARWTLRKRCPCRESNHD
jgi:hypothetical protein